MKVRTCIYVWAPHFIFVIVSLLFQYSPSFSDDEQPTFELWVATSNARHSVATIIDYSGKFTDIEVMYYKTTTK